MHSSLSTSLSDHEIVTQVLQLLHGKSYDTVVSNPDKALLKSLNATSASSECSVTSTIQSFDPFTHCFPFDTNYQCYGDDLLALVEEFAPQMEKIKKFHESKHTEAMNVLLANLYCNHQKAPGFYTAIGRAHGFYKATAPYNASGLATEVFVEATDTLQRLGLIEFIPHIYIAPGSHKNRVSRIRPATSLLEWFDEVDRGNVGWHPDKEVIFLKDEEKQLVAYGKKAGKKQDQPAVLGIRKRLREYNALLQQSEITFPWDDLAEVNTHRAAMGKRIFDPRACDMYRVFNVNFAGGGRFYAPWWAQLSSKDRSKIRINGEAVVELDFSAYHPTLLYLHEVKELPEGDVYDLPVLREAMSEICPSELRAVIKKAFLVLLNADDKTQAKQALREAGRMHEKLDLLRTMDLDMLFHAIEARHPAIWKFFGSGMASKLQNWDSKVADCILNLMMRERQIPCLPVHDSFIVAAQHADTLRAAMEKAMELNGWSHCPRIDQK